MSKCNVLEKAMSRFIMEQDEVKVKGENSSHSD